MPVNLSGSVSVSVSVNDQRTSVAGALNETGLRTAAVSGAWSIATGTGGGLADMCWADVRTLTTGQTVNIDFTAVLNDAFGTVLTFAKVKAFVIVAASTNTTLLTIARTAGATAPLFSTVTNLATLSAGGFFAWCDPLVGFVSNGATTAAEIAISNSAGPTATYSVAVVGTSV